MQKSSRFRSFHALPAGFFLGWAAPRKNQRNSAFLASPPCIFGAKNLIKTDRSRIQSLRTAPDSKSRGFRFVSF